MERERLRVLMACARVFVIGSLLSKLPNLVVSNCKLLLVTDKNSEIQQLFQKYNLGGVVTEWNNEILHSMLEILLLEERKDKKINSNFVNELFSIKSLIKKIL